MHNPSTNHVCPQFYTTHEDEFQTVNGSNSNEIPKNYRDVFTVDHHADNPNFTTPLYATMTDKDVSVRVILSD